MCVIKCFLKHYGHLYASTCILFLRKYQKCFNFPKYLIDIIHCNGRFVQNHVCVKAKVSVKLYTPESQAREAAMSISVHIKGNCELQWLWCCVMVTTYRQSLPQWKLGLDPDLGVLFSAVYCVHSVKGTITQFSLVYVCSKTKCHPLRSCCFWYSCRVSVALI